MTRSRQSWPIREQGGYTLPNIKKESTYTSEINLEIKNIIPIFVSTNNQNRKSMREQHIPVGIYDTEIFIIAALTTSLFSTLSAPLRTATSTA